MSKSRERKRSSLEQTFLDAWREYGIGKIPQEQHRFHPTRRFLLDFAWPKQKVAVETDGFGTGFNKFGGGHQRHKGMSNDNTKQNLAIEHGWIILRYTSRCLGSKAKRQAACEQILRVLSSRNTNKEQR